MLRALKASASDLMMPDVARIGGVTGWMQAVGLATAAGIEISSHLMPEISAQLLCATPHAQWLEYVDWADGFLEEPLPIVDGLAMPSERPGSGVAWNEQRLKTFGLGSVSTAKRAIDHMIAPLCIGQDASQITALMLDVQKRLHVFGRNGPLMFGISAVIALLRADLQHGPGRLRRDRRPCCQEYWEPPENFAGSAERSSRSYQSEKLRTAVSETPDAKMQNATAVFFVVTTLLLLHDALVGSVAGENSNFQPFPERTQRGAKAPSTKLRRATHLAKHLRDTSMPEMYLEDFKPGDRFSSPGITVTESMIIDFALAYDPQPFHLDLKAAADSHFGGLIASGIQTLALGFRAFLQLGLFRACGMGSPGLDELRWLRPVRPGDTLRSEVEVIDVRPSRSKSDRGMLVMSFKIRNQRDEEVLTMRNMQLTRRRANPSRDCSSRRQDDEAIVCAPDTLLSCRH
jgi:acyl dehydratase